MKAHASVEPGVCGFATHIEATCDDGQNVTFEMRTDCEKNQAFAAAIAALGPIDAFHEISPQGESALMAAARGSLKGCCAACIVPVSVFKTMQVAAGLALPQDLSARIEKE